MNENHVVCLITDIHDGKFPYVMNDLHIWSIYGQPIKTSVTKQISNERNAYMRHSGQSEMADVNTNMRHQGRGHYKNDALSRQSGPMD